MSGERTQAATGDRSSVETEQVDAPGAGGPYGPEDQRMVAERDLERDRRSHDPVGVTSEAADPDDADDEVPVATRRAGPSGSRRRG